MARTASVEHTELGAELVRIVQAFHLVHDGRGDGTLMLGLMSRLSRARARRLQLALAEVALVVHDIGRAYLDQGPPPPRAS